MSEDLVSKLMRESYEKAKAAEEKYNPIVRRLPDLEFAGLYKVVLEERDRRIARLIVENPIVREMAIKDMLRAQEDEDIDA